LAGVEIKEYDESVKNSRVVKELKESRNFKNGFNRGLWFGLFHGFITSITKGKEPWTLPHRTKDSDATSPKNKY